MNETTSNLTARKRATTAAPCSRGDSADCGQEDRPLDPSVGEVVREVAQEVTDLDGRIVRSVRRLFLSPGFLTLEHFAGRRVAWVSPVRLYLIFSVCYFAIVAVTGEPPLEVNLGFTSRRQRGADDVDPARDVRAGAVLCLAGVPRPPPGGAEIPAPRDLRVPRVCGVVRRSGDRRCDWLCIAQHRSQVGAGDRQSRVRVHLYDPGDESRAWRVDGASLRTHAGRAGLLLAGTIVVVAAIIVPVLFAR